MWEMYRSIGSAKYYVYKDADVERIKLRMSIYKDELFKITIISYDGLQSYIKTLKVPSGELEDIQNEAVKYFNTIKKKERKALSNFIKTKKLYDEAFKTIKDTEEDNES